MESQKCDVVNTLNLLFPIHVVWDNLTLKGQLHCTIIMDHEIFSKFQTNFF